MDSTRPTAGELIRQMENLQQQNDETLSQYYERTCGLMQAMSIKDRTRSNVLLLSESMALYLVIERFIEGIQDLKLRTKIIVKYFDVTDSDARSLKEAYEVGEHQLKVIRAKKQAQKKDKRMMKDQVRALANAVSEITDSRGVSFETVMNMIEESLISKVNREPEEKAIRRANIRAEREAEKAELKAINRAIRKQTQRQKEDENTKQNHYTNSVPTPCYSSQAFHPLYH